MALLETKGTIEVPSVWRPRMALFGCGKQIADGDFGFRPVLSTCPEAHPLVI
jgi:hypothetical protein